MRKLLVVSLAAALSACGGGNPPAETAATPAAPAASEAVPAPVAASRPPSPAAGAARTTSPAMSGGIPRRR
jgi:hypothetical protein